VGSSFSGRKIRPEFVSPDGSVNEPDQEKDNG